MDRRGTDHVRRCGLLLAAAAAASCSAQDRIEPKFSVHQCQRVELLDTATGAIVRGAEDLALDAGRGRLIVSAYDRRAVEKAVAMRAFRIPEGGVYAVSLADMTMRGPVSAAPIVRGDDIAGGLRPHGVSYFPKLDEIAFINRAYQKIDGRWRMTARVQRIGVNGEPIVSSDAPAPCAANDLIHDDLGVLVSFDHQSCGWRGALEDVLALRRSGVAAEDGQSLFDGAGFANGMLEIDGGLAVAATRERALLIIGKSGGGLYEVNRISLPGGPDNLTPAAEGGVIAAVHPSLLRMGAARRLGLGKAPSRVVKAQVNGGGVEILYDDASGDQFSGASVAVEWNGALILGSATDSGLLYCKAGG